MHIQVGAQVPDQLHMDLHSLSLVRYLQPRLMGKVRRRVQEVRYTSSPISKMDLSHNETARLATDALLDRGLASYHEALARDAEVDFLSQQEKEYILRNLVRLPDEDGAEGGPEREDAAPRSTTTCFPDVPDDDPSALNTCWPAQAQSRHLQGKPSVELFLPTNRLASVRDLLRECINKATTVLAIVTDAFSDVELFCDILQATRKRNVSTYLLLDHNNLHLFLEMCEKLHINSSHLTRVSVRTVHGSTYCSKSGRKFIGQVTEKFVIIDGSQVLAGSFSFTWLSWQVHRGVAVLFKGSSIEPFDLEFRQLYASSKPIEDFPVPPTAALHHPLLEQLHLPARVQLQDQDPQPRPKALDQDQDPQPRPKAQGQTQDPQPRPKTQGQTQDPQPRPKAQDQTQDPQPRPKDQDQTQDTQPTNLVSQPGHRSPLLTQPLPQRQGVTRVTVLPPSFYCDYVAWEPRWSSLQLRQLLQSTVTQPRRSLSRLGPRAYYRSHINYLPQ